MGRPDSRHHILALGVHQVFTVEGLLAGGRVAGEGHAGAAVLAHVAEHHGLNVDGGAEVVRDLVDLPVEDRPGVVPGIEHRLDRQPELIGRVLGKIGAGLLLDDRLVLLDDLLEQIRRQQVVVAQSVPGPCTGRAPPRTGHARSPARCRRTSG